MSRIAGLRPLSQVTAYGVAVGGVVGGGAAALLTLPFFVLYAQFGLFIATIPAFALGQAVGVATGFIAPMAGIAALQVVRPRTVIGWRATVAIAVTILCALPVGLLFVILVVPLTLFGGNPLASAVIFGATLVVAPIAAWRLSPALGRSPNELRPSRSSRAGWWLIAIGLAPVVAVLASYGAAWMSLNFDFDPDHHDQAVAFSLVLPLAVIDTIAVVLLSVGIALVVRTRWQHAELVMFLAAAALCTAAFSAIGFWKLVVEAVS